MGVGAGWVLRRVGVLLSEKFLRDWVKCSLREAAAWDNLAVMLVVSPSQGLSVHSRFCSSWCSFATYTVGLYFLLETK